MVLERELFLTLVNSMVLERELLLTLVTSMVLERELKNSMMMVKIKDTSRISIVN